MKKCVKMKEKIIQNVQPMGGIRKPKTWFYAIGNGKKEFLDWLSKKAEEHPKDSIFIMNSESSKINRHSFLDGHDYRDFYMILISPGATIPEDELKLMKTDTRFTIKKYYKNSELPKILSDEL